MPQWIPAALMNKETPKSDMSTVMLNITMFLADSHSTVHKDITKHTINTVQYV